MSAQKIGQLRSVAAGRSSMEWGLDIPLAESRYSSAEKNASRTASHTHSPAPIAAPASSTAAKNFGSLGGGIVGRSCQPPSIGESAMNVTVCFVSESLPFNILQPLLGRVRFVPRFTIAAPAVSPRSDQLVAAIHHERQPLSFLALPTLAAEQHVGHRCELHERPRRGKIGVAA